MMESVVVLLPEIVLVAMAVAIYLGGAFSSSQTVWRWLALAAVVLAAVALAAVPTAAAPTLQVDRLAQYVRWLALGVGLLFVLVTFRPLSAPGTSEYVGSLLLVLAGTMLVATAANLILLFLGLELVSIPTYILLFLARRDTPSREATAKYFFLSLLASALLLYGFSFVYGVTGSMELRPGALGAQAPALGPLAKIALVLILAGLGFRITAVPFHFYAPDVYQGTTHGNAGLLSIVPKIAGFVALLRLLILLVGLPELRQHAWMLVAALSIVTMSLGNVVALWQDNLRRLMAYSSIAHAGYLLIALAVFLAPGANSPAVWDGLGALLFYLLVYAVATLGIFAALAALGEGDTQLDGIDELAGLGRSGGWRRPALAWCLALLLFSLTGIPPLAGFWGKLAVFGSALGVGGAGSAVRFWFLALAVIGVLNAAVAAAYYLRIIGVMFFRLPLAAPALRQGLGGAGWAALVCGVLVLGIGLGPGLWMGLATEASPTQTADRPAAASHVRATDAQLPQPSLAEAALRSEYQVSVSSP